MARDSKARAQHAPFAQGHARTGAWRAAFGGAILAALLAACGGANEQDASAGGRSAPLAREGHDRSSADNDASQGAGSDADIGGTGIGSGPGGRRVGGPGKGQGTSRTDAFRLLTQATFGPTESELEHVMTVGSEAWIDEQLAKPVRARHLARWIADNHDEPDGASSNTVVSSFYQEAIQDDDQLRQRLTFALTQIFVVSMVDLGLAGSKSQSVASYLDMLDAHAFGTIATCSAQSRRVSTAGASSSMADRAEPEGRPHPRPELRPRGDAAVLDRPGRPEQGRHAEGGARLHLRPGGHRRPLARLHRLQLGGPDDENFFNDPLAQAKGACTGRCSLSAIPLDERGRTSSA